MPKRVLLRQLSRLQILLLALSASCIVDEDAPCGSNTVELAGKITGCVCAPGSVPNASQTGCEPCGEHEEAKGGKCDCVSGYARASASAACEEAEDSGQPDASDPNTAKSGNRGEGMACTSDADCAGTDATFCQTLQMPNVCMIQGCETGEHKCPSSEVCCSFKGFALLEKTNGLCVPDGKCIAPGMVVTP